MDIYLLFAFCESSEPITIISALTMPRYVKPLPRIHLKRYLPARGRGAPGAQKKRRKGCAEVTRKKTTCIASEYLPILPSPSSSSPSSTKPFQSRIELQRDKFGDGSVIIPSRIRTYRRLRIRVALHLFLSFPPPFFYLPFFPSLFFFTERDQVS